MGGTSGITQPSSPTNAELNTYAMMNYYAMLFALIFVEKFNPCGGIVDSVIPESAVGGYPESRKQQEAAGYRITAAPRPV